MYISVGYALWKYMGDINGICECVGCNANATSKLSKSRRQGLNYTFPMRKMQATFQRF